MSFFRNQMFNRQPMGFAPRQSRFSGGLGGLFGGMGGYNPYQQQMPMMGGFNPYMGGGFNPYMGGGFNPYMRGGFNPYMGGRFSPMMRGGFEGYDFDSPIGEAPPGVEPTPPPPPPSISDLYGGLDEAQRNAFLEQYGLAPTPPPPAPIERPDVDERDMFDSGSVPGEPRMGTMGGPVYDDAGNLIGNLGTAGPTFPPGVLGPIGGGQRPIPPQDFGFGPGIRPTEIIGPDGSFVGSGSVTPPEDRATAIPQPDPAFDIPGVDLEKIRESLAKMEPIIPSISLPAVMPDPGRGTIRPGPMPVKGPQPYKNIPIKAQPPVNVPMPAPMPVKGPGRIRISDPIRVPPPVKVPMPVKGPTLPIKRSPPPVKVPMPVKGPTLPIKRSPPPVKVPMPMPSPVIHQLYRHQLSLGLCLELSQIQLCQNQHQ
jgi:hypothetical protein